MTDSPTAEERARNALLLWFNFRDPDEDLQMLRNVAAAIRQAEAAAVERAVTDMLDRVLESSKTMTRLMLIDWLEREQQAIRARAAAPEEKA